MNIIEFPRKGQKNKAKSSTVDLENRITKLIEIIDEMQDNLDRHEQTILRLLRCLHAAGVFVEKASSVEAESQA
jgi:hypothetical protein